MLKRPLPSASLGKAVGTSYYVAPEVFDQDYNEKCDCWSIGCILYAMLTGVAPFDGDTDAEIIAKVRRGKYEVEVLENAGVTQPCMNFIAKLLTKVKNLRISAEDALKDPWITEHFNRNLADEQVNDKILGELGKFKTGKRL